MHQETVTIILPTFQEAESLPSLLAAVAEVREQCIPNLQLIIVDDNSEDGTETIISELDHAWVQLLIRKEEKGLSTAVIRGLQEATSEYCIVMDADGSHPASAIPKMVEALKGGADFTVGSRYIPGGSTEDGWGVLRWLNSKIATLMARPFTKVKDPMSGFLGLRRTTFDHATNLDPVGYKIGLELIVKCGCTNVVEVPIHFRTRQLGESKLTLQVQWEYLQHIIRLLRYTHAKLVSFCTFAAVGFSGLGIYIAATMLTTALITPAWLAICLAIWIAMTWNFFWDRKYAFWNAKNRSIASQYIGFLLVCSGGAVANYLITSWIVGQSHGVPLAAFVGGLSGSLIGILFNFFFNKLFVFRSA
ncbi:MAG: glycosyltransferase family 2 protein [Phycisphaerales bacterium]|jgi:dolichol-phosphate mannosyltransferase|nr:glycosyltransferase family 2 protein [Phycisphaerales bacterium]